MAVSQYLRPGSLLDAVKSQFTPDIIRSASSLVGESEPSTRQTLNGAVPSILTGLTGMASSREGASGLAGLIRDGGYGAAVDNARSLFGGGSVTNNMMGTGQQLLGKIFGNKLTGVNNLVAKYGAVSSSSASKLLSLAAPLTLGVLGKRAAAQGLDASGLANSLLSEKADIAAAAPAGLTQLLGGGPTLVSRTTDADVIRAAEPVHLERVRASDVPGEPVPRRPMRWLPLALAALAALAILLFVRGRTARSSVDNIPSPPAPAVPNPPAHVDLPGGNAVNVPKGTINYNLASFLADKSATDLPKNFVFDHLNFVSGSTRLTSESVATVNDMAMILRSYPNARVQLVGHTDSTGSAAANQSLSLARANTVKGLLVGQGVAANRISTTGYGQTRPVASNDNEAGRAQNRRLELNVTSK
ncbi:MAG TPA: OmpA family protein [Candidatus Angelobacter sp.]|nr:OmpA family protein [Candidatus Angelobacter sp.]